jgi:hypothetical protein
LRGRVAGFRGCEVASSRASACGMHRGGHPLPTGEGRRGARIAESESSQNSQRCGGVRGQGFPRFTSQLLWWLSRWENPSPRLFRAGCSELIHSTPDCALQSRPSPVGRGWGRRPTVVIEDQSRVWTPDPVRRGTRGHPLPTGEGRRGATAGSDVSRQRNEATRRGEGSRPSWQASRSDARETCAFSFACDVLREVANASSPHPGLSALTAVKPIHSTQDCALRGRPSPGGRGWPQFVQPTRGRRLETAGPAAWMAALQRNP